MLGEVVNAESYCSRCVAGGHRGFDCGVRALLPAPLPAAVRPPAQRPPSSLWLPTRPRRTRPPPRPAYRPAAPSTPPGRRPPPLDKAFTDQFSPGGFHAEGRPSVLDTRRGDGAAACASAHGSPVSMSVDGAQWSPPSPLGMLPVPAGASPWTDNTDAPMSLGPDIETFWTHPLRQPRNRSTLSGASCPADTKGGLAQTARSSRSRSPVFPPCRCAHPVRPTISAAISPISPRPARRSARPGRRRSR